MEKRLTRREVMRVSAIGTALIGLAACQPQEVERVVEVEKIVEQTVEVEKVVEVEKIVEKEIRPAPAALQPATVVVMYQRNELSEDEQAQFEEKYAPIKIEYLDNDSTKMMAMIAGGQQIDLFREGGVMCESLVFQRLIKDLTDYFETSEVFREEDFFPINDYFVVHGRRYSIVKDWTFANSLWVNKRLFEEMGVPVPSVTEPMHYREWRELSPKLSKWDGDRLLQWGTAFTPQQHVLLWLTTTFDPPTHLFNEEFTRLVLLDNPDTVEACKFWLDWKAEKGIPSSMAPSLTDWAGPDFRNGLAAAVQYGFWFSSQCTGEEVAEEDVLHLPAPLWGPTYSNPNVLGAAMYMTSVCREVDAAWKVMEWYLGEEPSVTRASSGWGIPALRSQYDLIPKEGEFRRQLWETVEYDMEHSVVQTVKWTPYIPMTPFLTSWSKWEHEFLNGDLAHEQVLANVEKEVNEAILESAERGGVII